MKELSRILYKGTEILYVDYSNLKYNKERTIQLIFCTADEYKKYPLKSALVIVNFSNLFFDNEIIHAFKVTQEETFLYQKRVALIGLKGLQVLGYNYIIQFKYRDMVRVFNNISAAKEWLVQDRMGN